MLRRYPFVIALVVFLAYTALAAIAGTTDPSKSGTPLGLSGTATANHCVKFLDSSGTVTDAGANCSSGGTGTVTNVATTGPITGGPVTTTGTIACATCATTTNGGALSGTAPIAVSAAGVISGGGLGTVTGALKGNGSGTITQAACSDLSNGATGCSTATGTSGATLPLLNGANTHSGATTFSAAGAASTPGATITGVPFAGTGTTSFPQLYVNVNTATASTTLNTNGTALGVNSHGTSDLINLLLDGTFKFKVASDGSISAANNMAFTTGGGIQHLTAANAQLLMTSNGTTVTRNVADTNATLSVTQTHASSTGDIQDWSNSGGIVHKILQGGQEVNVGNGAASVPAYLLSGTVLTGGTGTTNFPHVFVQPAGTTAATSWSTSGTGLGMNLATGFAGKFIDAHIAGGAALFTVNNDGSLVAGTAAGAISVFPVIRISNSFQFNSGKVITSATAPTIASGFGTSPSVPNNNGTAAFTINVGTGGTATSGVVTMPAATAGWACNVTPNAAPQAGAEMFSVPTSTTSITITNYTSSTGVALAWPASAVLQVTCTGY
jgi:hypothetical protein